MNFFRRKLIDCKICGKKTGLKKSWAVNMNTAEGKHQIRICEDCAKHLEKMEKQKYGN